MLEPILPNDDPEDIEIQSKGYTETVHPLSEEKALEPMVVDPQKLMEEQKALEEKTAKALEIRYRIFNGDQIRMQRDESGNVWFVADDVCKILGYSKDTASVIKQHCNKVYDSKDLEEGKELTKKITVNTKGGAQAMVAINEPDLYRLILRSRKEEAKAFEKWVMEDVLPTIRKTGKYKVCRKISPEVLDKVAPEASEPVQLELFPNNFTFSAGKSITDKMNEAKRNLASNGHTFPNNKEYLKFIIMQGLKAIENGEVEIG